MGETSRGTSDNGHAKAAQELRWHQVKELPGHVQHRVLPAATGLFPPVKWDVLCLIKYSKTMKEKASLAVGNYSV